MPVTFDQHIEIDAPVETVWSILTDPNKWPLWFADMERVLNFTAVKTGSTFQWQKGDDTGDGSIVHVDTDKYRIRVVTQMGSDQVTHTFDVDRAGGLLGIGGNDAGLKYTMEYDPPGGFISDFVASGNPRDALRVKHTLEKVKELAEGQAGKR